MPRKQEANIPESQGSVELREHYASLMEPGSGKVTRLLLNIVTIAVCAVICGADDSMAIAEFGRLRGGSASRSFLI